MEMRAAARLPLASPSEQVGSCRCRAGGTPSLSSRHFLQRHGLKGDSDLACGGFVLLLERAAAESGVPSSERSWRWRPGDGLGYGCDSSASVSASPSRDTTVGTGIPDGCADGSESRANRSGGSGSPECQWQFVLSCAASVGCEVAM